MNVRGVEIDDTFAEAFAMSATAITITGPTGHWAMLAATSMTGFATSIIGCGCEAGIDRQLGADETPDGRPGIRVLVVAMSPDELQKQLANRIGQCVLTTPGSACFSGIEGGKRLKLGDAIRYFGDGWQISKRLDDGRHFWRVPVMDGEFLCEATSGLVTDAVGGGNLLIMGRSYEPALRAAEAAIDAMRPVPDVIMPFPGGIVRAGTKIGSKYKGMPASTNEAYCPTLRGAVETALDPSIACVLEIVIDGMNEAAVAAAMRAGLRAIVKLGPKRGAVRVSAGNYGGGLGPFKFHLKDLVA
jgi:formylmethanofuran--tetrahydromethanopterin N-formyltransferase